jgi:hypothetical protein
MKKLGIVAAAVAALVAAGAAAAENSLPDSAFRARIDIDGAGGKIPMKAVKNCSEWTGEEKTLRITSDSGPLKDSEWKTFEISFTPEKDGAVIVDLRGQYFMKEDGKTVPPVWVLFTDVKADGADIKNGSFTELAADGGPSFWSGGGTLVDVTSPPGGKAVRVWHNKPKVQEISVKAGQTVTITAKVQKALQ